VRGLGAHQALGREAGVGVADGMEVHAPAAGGVSQGGERRAGLEGAGGDAVAEGFRELMVEREWGGGVERQSHWCYITLEQPPRQA